MKSNESDSALVRMDAAMAGPLFMLSAALLFTVFNLLLKMLGPQYTVWHIAFFRFFGGMVVLLMVFGRHGNLYKGHNTRLLIIRGCVGSAAFISLILAIRLLPLSTAVVIFYCYPAFAAIFAFMIYRERIGVLEIGCVAAVIAGVAILFDFHLAGGLWGQTMAVVGGAFAGMTVTLIRSLRQYNGPVIIYLYFCTILTFPAFIAHPILPGTAMEWAMVLGIVFSSVTAQLLMNQGFFYCKGWEGGVFMSSEVVFTGVVGIVFLNDPATPRFWIGGLMILASVVALNRLKAGVKVTPIAPPIQK
jgi:drug/metabolite transporter (DMT)-like permease